MSYVLDLEVSEMGGGARFSRGYFGSGMAFNRFQRGCMEGLVVGGVLVMGCGGGWVIEGFWGSLSMRRRSAATGFVATVCNSASRSAVR